VETSGQNRIWVVKGANDKLAPADIDAAKDTLLKADFIVLQLEIPVETVYYTLRFAREHGISSILNPAPGQRLDLRQMANADYVIPNETEAEALSGSPVTNVDEARRCAQGLLGSGVRRMIVTLGANGALLAGADGDRHVAPFKVATVDTTGAGDAFIGSLACFLASGMDEIEAISRANLYAALSTTGPGTQKSFVKRDRFDAEWSARLV
jgi:ribokinase